MLNAQPPAGMTGAEGLPISTQVVDVDGQHADTQHGGDALGGQAGAFETVARLDVTDSAGVCAAAAWIEQEYGKLDILINNARITIADGPPSYTTSEEADQGQRR